jgi:xylulose-5-phosphate/fructose-6-phosphate phosphoketolase
VIRHGHGGPSLVAHAYLEGTSEVYPNIEQNEDVALRPPAES